MKPLLPRNIPVISGAWPSRKSVTEPSHLAPVLPAVDARVIHSPLRSPALTARTRARAKGRSAGRALGVDARAKRRRGARRARQKEPARRSRRSRRVRAAPLRESLLVVPRSRVRPPRRPFPLRQISTRRRTRQGRQQAIPLLCSSFPATRFELFPSWTKGALQQLCCGIYEEHYNNYVAQHKADAEYLNKPLEHYGEMQTIFGNSMATGKFARDSNSALGTEDNSENVDVNANAASEQAASPGDHGDTSAASKPTKAKISDIPEDGLVAVFKSVGESIAKAIEKVAAPPPPPSSNDLPDDLLENLTNLPGFDPTHIAFYYAHLVANPHIGRAFYKLPFNYKLAWVSMFIAEKFPEQ